MENENGTALLFLLDRLLIEKLKPLAGSRNHHRSFAQAVAPARSVEFILRAIDQRLCVFGLRQRQDAPAESASHQSRAVNLWIGGDDRDQTLHFRSRDLVVITQACVRLVEQ